jgi:hypothetical protein
MSRPVQITFDAMAERWEIGYADAVGTTLPIDEGGGLWVGRNATGDVIEIVVDAAVLPPNAVALITEVYGHAAAEVVGSAVPGRDLEVQLTTNLPARVSASAAAIEGEPGVPRSRAQGGYVIPVEAGELELRVMRGELRLRLPATFGAPDWWVRVSDAETGDLLAMAPVRTGDDGPQASLAFGLDMPPDQLHVNVTSQPLAPVGTRLERRTIWVEQLLTESTRVRRTRPRLAKRLAARARDVALLIGDTERRRRAERLTRRRSLWGLGSMSMLTLVVIVMAGVLFAGRGSTPAPATTTTSPAASTTTTSVMVPGDVGPATFELTDGATIEAALVGVFPEFAPGEAFPVSVQVTTWLRSSFGPSPDAAPGDPNVELEAARLTCLGVTEQSPVGSTYTLSPFRLQVFLDRLAPDGERRLERVIVGAFDASLTAEAFTSDKESCRSPEFDAANRFEADTSVRRTPQQFDVRLPDNLPAGLWELTLVGPTETVARQGSLRVRVTP